jgi:CheY-like chemotaxis protein
MPLENSVITVLVVEDDAFLRLDLVDTFQTAGYEVLDAANAEDALRHLQDGKRIDVVVTDIQLGGELTGWDVAEKFRAAHADILIIYVSGNADGHARRVAGSVFFTKPCRAWDILKVCRGMGRVIGDQSRPSVSRS